MAKSSATSVEAYLDELRVDRRRAIKAVREVILAHLPVGYVETMQWGMISYVIPLERHGDTYNKLPLALVSLADQKNYMAIYLNNVYGDPDLESWFTSRYLATGKRLDMGKSCVRFRNLDDLPIDLVGEAVAKTPVDAFIAMYVEVRRSTARGH